MKKKRPPNRLSPTDIKIWKAVTRDVKRAHGKDYIAPEATEIQTPEKSAPTHSHHRKNTPAPTAKPQSQHPPQIDRRTDDRLRKGHIRPEATLDLHGMNQTQAHERLTRFIQTAHNNNKRCVLIITGKGEPRLSQARETNEASHWIDHKETGVLRRRVPDWLQTPPLSACVLKHHVAQPKDGGRGALYVYLKKNKT